MLRRRRVKNEYIEGKIGNGSISTQSDPLKQLNLFVLARRNN